MLKVFGTAAVALILAGCAVSPSPVTAPSGRPGYSMKCSGFGKSVQDCYAKAAELCPQGYNVEANKSQFVMVEGTGGTREYMLISCK